METLSAIENDSEPPALRWGLSFVRGYLELGMLAAAERDLERLGVRFRCNADVIELRVRVLLARSRWEKAAWLARSAAKVYPGVAEFYMLAARAYESLGRPDEAKAVWISAPSLFHVSGMFHFNLARFEAKLGNRRSAREHIALAIELDPSMQARAERDPGLRDILAETEN
jgi:tetratricopeptide (TPR) repeat protein